MHWYNGDRLTSHCVGRTLTAIDEVNKLLRLKADGILKCKDEFQSSTKCHVNRKHAQTALPPRVPGLSDPESDCTYLA